MKHRRYLLFIVTLLLAQTSIGQSFNGSHQKELLKKFTGEWQMINDSLKFNLSLFECNVSILDSCIDAICGKYVYIKKKDGKDHLFKGNQIIGENAHHNYSLYPSFLGLSYYDTIRKERIYGSLEVKGDTLLWRIRPPEKHGVTINGKVITPIELPKGWSVPIKAVLYRVKEEK